MKDNYLSVSETFYSLQGEGSTMGTPSVFLRLKSCNLLCGGQGTVEDKKLHDGSEWRCDTIEVWLQGQKKQHNEVLSEDFIKRLRKGAHLIITGGEPLLQQDAIGSYLRWFWDEFSFSPFIEIETNGTISPNYFLESDVVDQWNCSPKLCNSGVPYYKRRNIPVIRKLNALNTIFKFVITDVGDWIEIENDYLPYITRNKIWLMPAASSIEELLELNRVVAGVALDQGVKFCSRLQVEIWNKTTGV